MYSGFQSDYAVSADTAASFHFERPRLNRLLTEAVKHPLTVVCAGAGYGKTSAVQDFLRGFGQTVAWMQLSERDRVGTRFWENYTHTMARINKAFAAAISEVGFPDDDDKLNQYFSVVREHAEPKLRVLVFDDCHLIDNPAIFNFLERGSIILPQWMSVILISRAPPQVNLAGLTSRGLVYNVNEEDLRFTEQELAQYFSLNGITPGPESMRSIMQDTDGWAFAINLIARSFRKAPGYEGYLRGAMKTNIFGLMETEIWNGISERLQSFLISLSLIGHLSADLIRLLAGGDGELIAEFERQNAYVRRDDYINAYLIHHLFLEFLSGKQGLLTEEQKAGTYKIAADWCGQNGFKVDALAYYEKIGDYESVVSIFREFPTQAPYDVSRHAAEIFERTPAEAFGRVEFLAAMHVRAAMCMGLWREAEGLIAGYNERYSRLPADDGFRNRALGELYYCLGVLRTLLSTSDDRYDFDVYHAKQDKCLTKAPIDHGKTIPSYPVGPWINLVGVSRKGAPQEYIDALARSVPYASRGMGGAMTGLDDLAAGELKFYQGEFQAAENLIVGAAKRARECSQFDIAHRALYYLLRVAAYRGDYPKVVRTLKDMEELLGESAYSVRYAAYDIALGWYYCFVNLPERVPDWLKDKFTPYGHGFFLENFGNQIKVRYCYLTKKYPLLLAYIQDMKQHESALYGRLEILVFEACMYNKLKNREKALAVLTAAYEKASPNGIVMPFIGLGRAMRTLTAAALKEPDCKIPKDWLTEINRKSAAHAKRRAHVIVKYKQANRIADDVSFSPRELEVLSDLSHGLSRTEIAASRGLSVNTVKMVINMVYLKLQAENLADLIRVAAERKMI